MDRELLNHLVEKSINDIERKLPEHIQSSIHISPIEANQYLAKVKIKGLGKTVAISETGEDCHRVLRDAKRKALSKAQSLLRKKRGRWRRSYCYEKFLPHTAS